MAGEIDLTQFHEVFFEESFEGIEVMESGLLALDLKEPNSETINNVFRAAHSIKGGAGTFGFQEIADFTHKMESLLDDVRGQTLAVTDNLVQMMLESVDFLKHLLVECQAERTLDVRQIEQFAIRLDNYDRSGGDDAVVPVSASVDAPANIDEVIADSELDSADLVNNADAAGETSTDETESNLVYEINLHCKPSLLKSGNDPYRLIRDLSALGRVETTLDASELPDFDDLDPELCYFNFTLKLSETDVDEARIADIFDWVEDDLELTITKLAVTGEVLVDKVAGSGALKPVDDSPENPLPVVTAANHEVTSIRVNIERVDLLVNLVGELVITQSMLSRFKDGEEVDVAALSRGIEQLEENTRELQEQTMRIRMLPIDNVFQRMPRLVRDLSKTLDKEVNLELIGKATEVDKTVLEKISDPLTHLVRNCLDHGIETPAERKRVGKSATGCVEISAYHEGGSIIIQVKDDGRGLNRNAIVAKAVERQIIDADAELTEAQIDQLIFAPGFSTAEQVSDVSGRGVGMDVVKNNIEQLNGHIDVKSVEGEGSSFKIKLPLTLAIIEGQLVRVGSDVFVVPLLSIVKSSRVTADGYNLVGGETRMYRLDDEYLPVVPLSDVYRIRSDYEEASDAILVIVDAVERYGILVDEVLGQQQVVVKSLETNFKEVPTISGATILGDGTVAMILDMAGLIRESRKLAEYA